MFHVVFVAVIASAVVGAMGLLREGLKQATPPEPDLDSCCVHAA